MVGHGLSIWFCWLVAAERVVELVGSGPSDWLTSPVVQSVGFEEVRVLRVLCVCSLCFLCARVCSFVFRVCAPRSPPPSLYSVVDACLSLMDAGPAKRKRGGAVIDPAHAAPGTVIHRASEFLFLFGGG